MDIVVQQVDPNLAAARRHYCTARHEVIGWFAAGLPEGADVFCPLCGALALSRFTEYTGPRSTKIDEYDGSRCQHGFPDANCFEVLERYPIYDYEFLWLIPAFRLAVLGTADRMPYLRQWAHPCALCRDRMAVELAAALRHELEAVSRLINAKSREAARRIEDVKFDIMMLRRAEGEIRDAVERLRELAPDASFEPKGFIYAIARTDAVKIGWSGEHPTRRRLSQLQSSSPDELELLGTFVGTLSDEAYLHRRFAKYRLRGEWFQRHDEIVAYFQNTAELS